MPSILAEPRRKKQRMEADPRNVQWRYSTDNFGAKLLGKMGWTEGKGIGKSEQGKAENVRMNANYNAKGFGYEITNDKLWVAHNDDFAQILAELNKNKEPSKPKATSGDETADASKDQTLKETKTERIRQRMKRKKFIRNLADCSESEKAGIFGSVVVPPSMTKDNTAKNSRDEKEDEADEQPFFGRIKANETHTISTVSMSDYFAQKMQQKFAQKSTKIVENGGMKVAEKRSDNKRHIEETEDEEEEARQRKAARIEERRRKQQLEEVIDAS